MVNQRLASRYAKSLMDLAAEQQSVAQVKQDADYILALTNASEELKAVLRSPVIKADKKEAILEALTAGKVSNLTTAFNRLLVRKGRETVLPEIFAAFTSQHDKQKGIVHAKVTTASPLDDTARNALVTKLKTEADVKDVRLTEKIDESLVGGFVLEYDNKRVDTSIKRELNDIRRNFLSNDYLFNIR